MVKTLGIVIAIVLVVALGIFVISSLGKSNDGLTGNAVSGDTENNADSDVVVIKITSSHLRFFLDGVESPELKVKQGDTIRIEFVNEEGFHDFVLDEFVGARTKQMAAGNSETIEFVADKKGTFEYYCSVGQHRANGMYGKFIVE
ncbi:MAG TPA: cupredoxin domain-containing protein [Candidatus Nanoarchaeia archaeon]|nr:cupredoxin domain-containing protein [Candidatus Nanoarchaeia archaeon]